MKKILLSLLFICIIFSSFSQILDKVVAVIGDEIVLQSDIETQYLQYLSQGYTDKEEIKCQMTEDILYQKLLVHQAKLDSIDISEDEVNKELERRLSSFISELGSQDALEKYFGKSIIDIKGEFYDVIYNQLLSQRMQSNITSSVSITPEEVKLFYKELEKNEELPLIPTKIQISQIVKIPEISSDEKSRIRKKLISFRQRINNGEDFKVLATLYSDDTESAKNGGELGFVNRGDLVPEFESAAYALKGNEISEVIETKFGYHIIQLIDRRGESINVRHILMKPKVSSSALLDAKNQLEKVETLLNDGSLSFKDAAKNHSNDISKNNGGLLINPQTGSSFFTIDQLNVNIRYTVERMNEGEVSSISQFVMSDGMKAYRIIKITKKIEEHKANLIDDFIQINDAALKSKKQNKISEWVDKKISNTYIRLSEDIDSCESLNKWKK
ncbi:MAG: peptidylprolyl isomerase [Flavobacteriales bacterium]|nr:peptidylprolyl isomerase [Flavobacteriales bacterium]|tara:strand:- start:2367 stop:3695 length:1329 start_codon:yes stop_codon:yes gene_type:complete